MSVRAYIGLGSNLGDRETALRTALDGLGRRGLRVEACSSFYWTEPVGGPPQEWYLNAVVTGRTRLTPEELLHACLDVEHEQGRVRGVRNGPRTLDVDLLLYGDEQRQDGRLELPHPRLHERRFVLVPLCEIDPQARHPRLGLTAAELLARCPDRSRVLRREAAGAPAAGA